MNVVKSEMMARESCESPERGDKEAHSETKALLTRNKILVSVFCNQNHYSDKCIVITDVDRRKEMVRRNRLGFKCFATGHPI